MFNAIYRALAIYTKWMLIIFLGLSGAGCIMISFDPNAGGIGIFFLGMILIAASFSVYFFTQKQK